MYVCMNRMHLLAPDRVHKLASARAWIGAPQDHAVVAGAPQLAHLQGEPAFT